MSDVITIENGTTGTLRLRNTDHHVGIRARGERFEVAYQGSPPSRLPIDCELDGRPMRAVERLRSGLGWSVLVLVEG